MVPFKFGVLAVALSNRGGGFRYGLLLIQGGFAGYNCKTGFCGVGPD